MWTDNLQHYLRRTGYPAFHPRAILFDMDGVLIDSMPNHVIAWHDSMATFGIKMEAMDAYMTEGARGVDTIRKMVQEQQGKTITMDEAQEMYNEKSRRFHLLPQAPLMPGILELMEKLSADNLTIGIVTGSGQRPLIERMRETFHQYVTDDHLGVMAGHAAKAFTIAVNTGILPDEALTDAGADLLLPSIAQLCEAWHELYNEMNR